MAEPPARRVTREILASISVGGVLPYVAYVVSRPHLSEVAALVLGGAFPAAWEIVSFVRHRRADPVSTLNLVGIGITTVLAVTGGSARFLLVKESLVTGAIGVAFLGSMFLQRPAHFYLARQFVTGELPERVARYNAAWNAVPLMRTVLRTTTLVWGIAFVAEVAVRVALIFRLSTPQMLVVGPVIFWGTTFSVIAWTVLYSRRRRHRIVASLEAFERAGEGRGDGD